MPVPLAKLFFTIQFLLARHLGQENAKYNSETEGILDLSEDFWNPGALESIRHE